jgi:hypothetical protein
MADVITGNTQVGATKTAAIAAFAQKELKFAAMLAAYFTDFSQYIGKGMKSLDIPKLTSFTAANRASGARGEATALTATVDRLALDLCAHINWIIDPRDEMQSTLQWSLLYIERAARAHGRYFDSALITELKNAGGVLSGVAADISRDKILEGREYIRKNNGDLNQSIILIAPDQETAMLKVDEFTRAEVYGQAVIQSGVFGRVYGMPVVVHNGLSDGDYIIAEKSGLGFGFQMDPEYGEAPDVTVGPRGKRAALEQLFGVKGLQIDAGDAVQSGKSGLIIQNA